MTERTPRQAQYLTVAEVAEAFRVTPATVYRWIDAGHLIALKLGRRTYRIWTEDYERFRAARHAEATDRSTEPAPVPQVPGQMPFPTDGLAAL